MKLFNGVLIAFLLLSTGVASADQVCVPGINLEKNTIDAQLITKGDGGLWFVTDESQYCSLDNLGCGKWGKPSLGVELSVQDKNTGTFHSFRFSDMKVGWAELGTDSNFSYKCKYDRDAHINVTIKKETVLGFTVKKLVSATVMNHKGFVNCGEDAMSGNNGVKGKTGIIGALDSRILDDKVVGDGSNILLPHNKNRLNIWLIKPVKGVSYKIANDFSKACLNF
ncbi:MAG: hypothetical protein A3K03_06650 [Bdellovibrionales bacterium RIFOXYD1_FULL_44_7]|nr:MAG: hypothetical protein A3K03_06650 [Bdellovibrionales bacterium RIFOXYD1_FULL_44_7]